MPKFPSKEAEVIALAQTIASGLQTNPTVFPNPPVTAAALSTQLAENQQIRSAITAAEAALKQEYEDKDVHYTELVQMMKSMIQYVELTAKGDEAVLAKIGWSGRAQPTSLQPPGQCRTLEILDQGTGWVRIDWKEPIDGGKVAAYRVQRSEDGGAFGEVASEINSIATLVNQPTGKRLTYQVVAFNKAGEGIASNTVSLVL